MDNTQPQHTDRLVKRAQRRLVWETYGPTFALISIVALAYVIGSSSGFWQRIGDPWRGIALAVSAVLIVRTLLKAFDLRAPSTSKAMRRLEHDNKLQHRPLDTVKDQLGMAVSEEGQATWKLHVKNAAGQLDHVRAATPKPVLAPIDPYYLRFAVPFVFLIAVMVGAGDNYERFRTGLLPTWNHGISAKNAHYEAWIDPPEYTGRPPSYFKTNITLPAPEGSEFVARISGVKTPPRLIIREGRHTRRITPTRLGPQSFEARVILTTSAKASYRIGNTTKEWFINVGNDKAPTISFETPPYAGKRDKLIFSYNLNDDFGVEKLDLVIHRKNDLDATDTISVFLPGKSVRSANKEFIGLDLTKHKWAGKEVMGHLVALDGKGQKGISTSETFIVPDKIFVEPMAKAIAEQRLLVIEGEEDYAAPVVTPVYTLAKFSDQPLFDVDRPDKTIERAPAPIRRSAQLIAALSEQPVGIFDDPTVYMGLRHVYRRLHTARSQQDLKGIPEDLWDIAIRAEFGLLGDALTDMQAAERALNNAMARRAPQREVDVLFERYNQAVDRYMEELMLKAIENAKNNPSEDGGGGGGGGESAFQTDEIQELLDAIEEANRIGDTAAARRALAQLAILLENMEIQLAQGSGSGDGPSDGDMSEEVKKALEDLNDLLGEQRKLRDETQERSRTEADNSQSENGDGTQGSQNGAAGSDNEPRTAERLAEEQERLEELLQQLEKGIGEEGFGEDEGQNPRANTTQDAENGEGGASESDELADGSGGMSREEILQALKDARTAMGDSQDALNDDLLYRSSRAQSNAIDALRQAGEGIARAAEAQSESAQRDGQGEDGNADPFGRDQNGGGVGDQVEVPEIDDQKRVRDLLDELRRRSGEQEREKIERDYLDRLLERF
jgi:hypothetical protein